MKPPYQLTFCFRTLIACAVRKRKQSLEDTLTKLVWPTQADIFLVVSGTANVARMFYTYRWREFTACGQSQILLAIGIQHGPIHKKYPGTVPAFCVKCLNRIAGVAEYLGPDGLGQFITGSYAANDPQADIQLTAVKISFERVDNFDACKREVLGVPRCDGQLELASRCGDETVFHRHGTPLFS